MSSIPPAPNTGVLQTCEPYICAQSPVSWTAIDVLAAITVVWIVFTFWYKGVRQYNILRYPQIEVLIPYSDWEKRLVYEKPPIGAGRAVVLFFKTLFVDVLAMEIFKCEYGRSEAEITRTKTAKRTAKLLIVWGFIFAGASTTLSYLTFPHDMIVLDLTNPARILGMLAGVMLLIGSAVWLAVRYKEVNYRGIWDLLGADYLPLIVLLIAVSGFVLQGAIWVWAHDPASTAANALLYFAIHFHAIPVALFFWAFFWTKADHIAYRFFWRIYEYADKELAGAKTRLPPTTLKPLNRTGKEIPPGY